MFWKKKLSRLYLIVALSCILPPNNNENLSLSTLQNHTKRNQKFGASEGKECEWTWCLRVRRAEGKLSTNTRVAHLDKIRYRCISKMKARLILTSIGCRLEGCADREVLEMNTDTHKPTRRACYIQQLGSGSGWDTGYHRVKASCTWEKQQKQI